MTTNLKCALKISHIKKNDQSHIKKNENLSHQDIFSKHDKDEIEKLSSSDVSDNGQYGSR